MKNIKLYIGIIIGLVISGIGVYALSINSKDITYKNTNVSDAIDELYERSGGIRDNEYLNVYLNKGQISSVGGITASFIKPLKVNKTYNYSIKVVNTNQNVNSSGSIYNGTFTYTGAGDYTFSAHVTLYTAITDRNIKVGNSSGGTYNGDWKNIYISIYRTDALSDIIDEFPVESDVIFSN